MLNLMFLISILDPNKLKEFGNNFRLQSSESQIRRPSPGNLPPPQQVGVPQQQGMPANLPTPSGPARNPSPPSVATTISSGKCKKDESPGSLPPLIPPANATTESTNLTTSGSSPIATASSTPVTTSASSVVSVNTSPSAASVVNVSVSESTPSSASMTSPATDNQTPSSIADSKPGEAESKKKFTFNPNAKEFNPSKFTSVS